MLAYAALVCAAAFTGATLYVSMAEHPARMRLDDGAALAQWQAIFTRSMTVQIGLALGAGLFALAAWLRWRSNWPWLTGGLIAWAAIPYGYAVLADVQRQLRTATPDAKPDIRALLQRWGALHTGRTALGTFATALIWYGFVGE